MPGSESDMLIVVKKRFSRIIRKVKNYLMNQRNSLKRKVLWGKVIS
jgi:hypothetical protein